MTTTTTAFYFQYRSESCPQCRKFCHHDQIKRIYIDFTNVEDLACGQSMSGTVKTDTDAEETIKILLEHIESGENGSAKSQKPENECDVCKEFQDAYSNTLTERDLISDTLNNIERENRNLMEKYRKALKIIEQLNRELRNVQTEHIDHSQEIKDRLEIFDEMPTL